MSPGLLDPKPEATEETNLVREAQVVSFETQVMISSKDMASNPLTLRLLAVQREFALETLREVLALMMKISLIRTISRVI